MRLLEVVSLVLWVGVEQASAQAAQWGQCGGMGWTGPTTCTAGNICFDQNPFYFQCIPGTASTTVVSSSTTVVKSISTSTTVVKSATSTATSATGTSGAKCTGTFTPITASAAFAQLNPGWNLGNTLEAVPTEGSWNNPPVVASVFAAIQAKGFKSIRVPVTWSTHLLSGAPNYLIDPVWMARVTTVVDEIIALGMRVTINMHGDAYMWANLEATSDYTAIEQQFTAMWTQIATNFACHSNLLMFEPLNEPEGNTQAQGVEMNRLNTLFLNAINAAGGFNSQRVVSLSGLGMDSIMTSEWFVRPTVFPNQPWGLQFHYYSPYQFIFSAWGCTSWGSAADKASLQADFANFHGNFSGIPTFIGEWSASQANTETAARWQYWDFLVRTANSFGYSTITWDNGADFFNRASSTFYDPTEAAILFNAVKGISNSLAGSTTDLLAPTQSTSAFLFQKVGQPVVSQTLPYLLNGNTLTSITTSTGTKLTSSQYSMNSAGNLTITAAYLSTILSSTSTPGNKANLTLTFSAGAPLVLEIVVYDTPTVSATTFAANPSSNLEIPITWKGLQYPATIKAIYTDGTYVDSSWTEFLGPLQQARWTYNNYYNWDANDIVIETGGSSEIIAGGKNAILMIEFFPRDGTGAGSNTVNVTITV